MPTKKRKLGPSSPLVFGRSSKFPTRRDDPSIFRVHPKDHKIFKKNKATKRHFIYCEQTFISQLTTSHFTFTWEIKYYLWKNNLSVGAFAPFQFCRLIKSNFWLNLKICMQIWCLENKKIFCKLLKLNYKTEMSTELINVCQCVVFKILMFLITNVPLRNCKW